jgi:hypothetical protein
MASYCGFKAICGKSNVLFEHELLSKNDAPINSGSKSFYSLHESSNTSSTNVACVYIGQRREFFCCCSRSRSDFNKVVAKSTTTWRSHVFNFYLHFQVIITIHWSLFYKLCADYFIFDILLIFVGQFSSISNAHIVQPKLRIEEIRGKRISIFDKEYKRQQSLIPRLEKIEVAYEGFDNETTTLVMNKGVSTPYNCAQRK